MKVSSSVYMSACEENSSKTAYRRGLKFSKKLSFNIKNLSSICRQTGPPYDVIIE